MSSESRPKTDPPERGTTSYRALDSRDHVEEDVPEDVDLGDAPGEGGPESDDPIGHGHAVAPPG